MEFHFMSFVESPRKTRLPERQMWGCFLVTKNDYEPLMPKLTIHPSKEQALLEVQDSIFEHLTKSIYQAIPYEEKLKSSHAGAEILLDEEAVVLAENGQVYSRKEDIPLLDELNKVILFKPFLIEDRLHRYEGKIEGKEPHSSVLYFNQRDFLFFLSASQHIDNIGVIKTLSEKKLWSEIKDRWSKLNYRPKLPPEDTQEIIERYLNKDRIQMKFDNIEIKVDLKS